MSWRRASSSLRSAPGEARRHAIERELDRSLTGLERMIARGRIAVLALLLARSTLVWRVEGLSLSHHGVALVTFTYLAAVAFSLYSLRHLEARAVTRPFQAMAIAVDTLVAGIALATNILWPWEHYAGLLFMPDLGALMIVAAIGGLRLSGGIALAAGALALLTLAALVGLDAALNTPLDAAAWQNLSGIGGLLIAVSIIGAVIAARTRGLVVEGAERSIAAERATRNLDLFLRSHHDLRTRLSAAGLDASLLERHLEGGLEGDGAASDEEPGLLLASIRRDVDEVDLALAETRQRSYAELLALQPAGSAEPLRAAETAALVARARFPDLVFALSETDTPPVLVRGGAEGLQYALQELMSFAARSSERPTASAKRAEDDPGATRPSVRLAVCADGDEVRIRIDSRFESSADGEPCDSASPESRLSDSPVDVIRLDAIRDLLEASGGRLELAADFTPGDRSVDIVLPTARGRRAVLPEASREMLDDYFAERSAAGERLISGWRIGLGVVSLGRSAWVWNEVGWGLAAPPLRLALPTFAALVVVSGLILWRIRDRVPRRVMLASTALDVGVCASALFTNALWPEPGYRGLLFMPETSALIVPVLVTALRLSPRSTLVSSLLSLAALAGIVSADVNLHGSLGHSGIQHLSALAGLIGASALIAWLTTRRTRAMVSEAAQSSLEAERASRDLGLVGHDHRRIRERIAAATSASRDLCARLARSSCPRSARAGAQALRADLDSIDQTLAGVQIRSYAELLAIQQSHRTHFEEALTPVVDLLRDRFGEIGLEIDPALEGVQVDVAGGSEGLGHILQNAIVNACEGDGRSGASKVWMRTRLDGPKGRLRLQILDDGPGFQESALADDAELATSKPDGGGMGLSLVRSLILASGGRLELSNRPEGGACVTIELPRSSSPERSPADARQGQ